MDSNSINSSLIWSRTILSWNEDDLIDVLIHRSLLICRFDLSRPHTLMIIIIRCCSIINISDWRLLFLQPSHHWHNNIHITHHIMTVSSSFTPHRHTSSHTSHRLYQPHHASSQLHHHHTIAMSSHDHYDSPHHMTPITHSHNITQLLLLSLMCTHRPDLPLHPVATVWCSHWRVHSNTYLH